MKMSNEHQQQIQQIEMSIEQANKRIEEGHALERLHSNADFKKIILDGYFLNEASRTVLLKADPNMQSKEAQKDCDNIIISIGMLRQYFAKLFTLANMAEQAIEADKEAREEILAEAAELEKGNTPFTVPSSLQ